MFNFSLQPMKQAQIHILKNEALEVHISTLGATITHMFVPDKKQKPVDIVLGLQNTQDYASEEYARTGAYLGAGIGRYANRIAQGHITINGITYQLATNNGLNHLHGGNEGFDKKIWETKVQNEQNLILQYISQDGEENYPGTLTVEIHFSIENKELRINYRAQTDKDCYVNLTHHPYFNLDPNATDIKRHMLKLYSGIYLKTRDLIPDGTFIQAQEDYNFTTPKMLQKIIDNEGGLDDCFVFDTEKGVTRQAELFCQETGIKLYICSDYPGLQVYTGKFLNIKNGKNGKHYGPFAGIALEAQYFPDSPNHPEFPSTLLKKGDIYRKTTIFGVE